jgi:uncharacterized membrane protein YcfT
VSATPYERARPAEVVAGYMSAAAIFVALMGLAVRPLPLTVAALLLSLVATGLGGRWGRLHALAGAVATIAFVLGMTIAVLTSRPLY